MTPAEAFLQEFSAGLREPKPAPSFADLWEMTEDPTLDAEDAARILARSIQALDIADDAIHIEYRLDGPMKSVLIVPFSELPPEERKDPITPLLAILKADVRAAAIKALHHQIPGG